MVEMRVGPDPTLGSNSDLMALGLGMDHRFPYQSAKSFLTSTPVTKEDWREQRACSVGRGSVKAGRGWGCEVVRDDRASAQ